MDKDLLLEELSPAYKAFSEITGNNKTEKELSIVEKYNVFVRCYNTPCNRVDEKNLTFVPEKHFFNSIFKILAKKTSLILYLVTLLIPLINIFLLISLFLAAYQYSKALKIFRKNEKRVENPFVNMKYDPEKCLQLKKNFYFMKIQFKSLRSEFNYKENISLTSSEGKKGDKSEWMIYNSEFEAYHSELPRWKRKFLILMVAAVIEVLISSIILVLILI